MKKVLAIVLLCTLASEMSSAQTVLKKVYDESINPIEQIDCALEEARTEGKFVICQVGGNWCPWCLRFADFISNDSVISKLVEDSFVYIHVNYNPRKKSENEQLSADMMQRLGSPARFGFPVLVVLDEEGHVIHIQDSSFLEKDKGYDREKVIRFFKNWTPLAVKR